MTIYNGDCLEVLRGLPDDSVDSCVTDPPYGLSKEPDISLVLGKWLNGEQYEHNGKGFMSKEWDSFVPHPDVWREVYRVLKPGGYALVFAGTRTQDLMTIALRMAGFEVRDVIEWLYFSGFPKSMDVGKAFDRRRNEDLPGILAVTAFIAKGRDASGKTNREIDEHFGLNGMAGHWTTQGSQPQVPKLDQWAELKTLLSLTDEMDAEVWRLNGRKGKPGDAWDEREKVGVSNNGAGNTSDSVWVQEIGGGIYDGNSKTFDITAPSTDLARQWDGWGTALKPAHEPIIVVRKPLIGTVADNVERYGTGGINIDGCRIGDEAITVKQVVTDRDMHHNYGNGAKSSGVTTQHTGRFPANAITTDDDAFYSPYFNVSPAEVSKKAGKKDRNADWTGAEITLPERQGGGMQGTVDKSLKTGSGNERNAMYRNTHPTVKPTDLMSWLVRLVTPPGGTVLDPFAGSGTTLVAAKREGFEFIGIEREAEYVEIIEARTKEPVTV